jgi:putative membrane protein
MKAVIIFLGLLIITGLTLSGCKQTYTQNSTNSNSSLNTEYGTANTNYGNSTMANSMPEMSNMDEISASDDTDFLNEAAEGGMAEVELGKLATTKAASPEVKKFGQLMVDDHSKAGNELKALASKKGLTLPTETDSSHKATIDDLRNRVGADFDKEYVESMYEDHTHDVAAFEEESRSATDPDVRAFASKTLPTLRKHLEMITAIRNKMGGNNANK